MIMCVHQQSMGQLFFSFFVKFVLLKYFKQQIWRLDQFILL